MFGHCLDFSPLTACHHYRTNAVLVLAAAWSGTDVGATRPANISVDNAKRTINQLNLAGLISDPRRHSAKTVNR